MTGMMNVYASDEPEVVKLNCTNEAGDYTYFDNHHYCATKEQVDNSDLYIIDPYGIGYFLAPALNFGTTYLENETQGAKEYKLTDSEIIFARSNAYLRNLSDLPLISAQIDSVSYRDGHKSPLLCGYWNDQWTWRM